MHQGEIVWLRFGGRGSEPSGRRPALVIQDDRFNQSAISTTVVAAITSNVRLAAMPGNVRLRKGEAGLSRPSVVNVSQIATVDRTRLGTPLGTLSAARLNEVRRGLALILGVDRLEP